MNIFGNNSAKLNEVIFEKRNKAYGAYAIRQSYNDSLFKSLTFLTGLIALIFGSAFLFNKQNAKLTSEKLITFNNPILDPIEYVTKVDMTPLPEPVQNTTAASTAPTGGMATRIVDDPVATSSININNPVSGVGTETATGVSPVGPETSTLTNVSTAVIPSIASSEAVIVAEEMPEFEGGISGLMRYVSQNIIYPSLAREIGKEGTVYVSFIVSETGQVENVNVMRGIGYGCDEEVVRVIGKMPRWKKVGKNAGHPVKVRFNIPVSFRLR